MKGTTKGVAKFYKEELARAKSPVISITALMKQLECGTLTEAQEKKLKELLDHVPGQRTKK